MLVTKPSYYDDFSCLAGSCPATCCGSWQVVIDPDSLKRYRSIGGALGDRIGKALTEADGEVCFAMEQGRCVLLTEEGLCLLQKELGPAGLCRNCDRYPRFITQIGARRELGLSLSCPEAARRILTEPWDLCTGETDEPLTDFHELSPELILTLQTLRSRALDLARDRSIPFGERCARILLLCAPADHVKRDRDLCAAVETGMACARGPLKPAGAAEMRRFFAAMCKTADDLEYLYPEFHTKLAAALKRENPAGFADACPALPEAWERLLCYGICKYFPRAAFDRSVWPTAVFCVTLPLLLAQMMSGEPQNDAGTLLRLAWTLSRELEHSDKNMETLFRSFRHRRFCCKKLAGVFSAFVE